MRDNFVRMQWHLSSASMTAHEIYKILFIFCWLFLYIFLSSQGVVLTHNASARVIRSNQNLVMQRVTRHSAGNYSCSAINAEGETVSNQLELRVKCKYRHSQWYFTWFKYILFQSYWTLVYYLLLSVEHEIVCSENFFNSWLLCKKTHVNSSMILYMLQND